MVDDGRRHPQPPDRRLRLPLTRATSSVGARYTAYAGRTRPGPWQGVGGPFRCSAE